MNSIYLSYYGFGKYLILGGQNLPGKPPGAPEKFGSEGSKLAAEEADPLVSKKYQTSRSSRPSHPSIGVTPRGARKAALMSSR
jgi:hypothetical protein